MEGRLPKLLMAVVVLCIAAVVWLRVAPPRSTARRGLPAVTHQLDAVRTMPQVSIGWQSGALVAPDGSLWWWGGSQYGQLAWAYSTNGQPTPMRFGNNTDWVAVSVGLNAMVALQTDGSLWQFGALPGNTLIPGGAPKAIIPGTRWRAVSVGMSHALAIRADGTLWAWGDNSAGQLGIGATGPVPQPVQIGTGTNWFSVAANQMASHGVQSDGTLWRWGTQWGMAPSLLNSSPTLSATNDGWISVVAGAQGSAAIRSDGSVWANGYHSVRYRNGWIVTNSFALLGTNGPWRSIAIGQMNSPAYGVRYDGSLWEFPAFNFSRNVNPPPRRFGQRTDWVTVAVGGGEGAAAGITRDGTVWAWGEVLGQPYNGAGEMTFLRNLLHLGQRHQYDQAPAPWPMMKFLPPPGATSALPEK